MLFNADLIVGGFTAALALFVFLVTRDVSRLGIVFIDAVLIIMGILSALILVKGFVKPERLKFFASTAERNNVVTGVAILLAALAPTVEEGPLNLNEVAFLRQVVAAGEEPLLGNAVERLAILDALRRHDGNRSAAARELGIHRSTFFRKIAAHEIQLPRRDGRRARRRSVQAAALGLDRILGAATPWD